MKKGTRKKSLRKPAYFLHPLDTVINLRLECPSKRLSTGAQVVLCGRRNEYLVDERIRKPSRAGRFRLRARERSVRLVTGACGGGQGVIKDLVVCHDEI